MNGRSLLALLVVLVLTVAFVAPSAMAVNHAMWRGEYSSAGDVFTSSWKTDGNGSSGDDDRWGDPNDTDAETEVATDEDTDGGVDPPPDVPPDEDPPAKSMGPGRIMLRFLFGNLFVL